MLAVCWHLLHFPTKRGLINLFISISEILFSVVEDGHFHLHTQAVSATISDVKMWRYAES